MKKSLQINLKDSAIIKLQATVKKTNESLLKVYELQEEKKPLFINVVHHKVNTVLSLDKIDPFVLLYFDENLEFTGAAYSLNSYDGSFGVGTIYKNILLIHYPIDFAIENVSHLTFID